MCWRWWRWGGRGGGGAGLKVGCVSTARKCTAPMASIPLPRGPRKSQVPRISGALPSEAFGPRRCSWSPGDGAQSGQSLRYKLQNVFTEAPETPGGLGKGGERRGCGQQRSVLGNAHSGKPVVRVELGKRALQLGGRYRYGAEALRGPQELGSNSRVQPLTLGSGLRSAYGGWEGGRWG